MDAVILNMSETVKNEDIVTLYKHYVDLIKNQNTKEIRLNNAWLRYSEKSARPYLIDSEGNMLAVSKGLVSPAYFMPNGDIKSYFDVQNMVRYDNIKTYEDHIKLVYYIIEEYLKSRGYSRHAIHVQHNLLYKILLMHVKHSLDVFTDNGVFPLNTSEEKEVRHIRIALELIIKKILSKYDIDLDESEKNYPSIKHLVDQLISILIEHQDK